MVFGINEALRKSTNKVKKNKLLNNIIVNPFYTALIIVFIIIIMILFVFRNVETDDESKLKMSLRVGAYSLIFITGIIFLHNKKLMEEIREHKSNDIVDDVFGMGEINKESTMENFITNDMLITEKNDNNFITGKNNVKINYNGSDIIIPNV